MFHRQQGSPLAASSSSACLNPTNFPSAFLLYSSGATHLSTILGQWVPPHGLALVGDLSIAASSFRSHHIMGNCSVYFFFIRNNVAYRYLKIFDFTCEFSLVSVTPMPPNYSCRRLGIQLWIGMTVVWKQLEIEIPAIESMRHIWQPSIPELLLNKTKL